MRLAAGLGSVFRLPAFLGSYPYAALRWCELGSAVPPKVQDTVKSRLVS